jgi:membrane protease YdiL (CAAX protease family)
MTSFFALSVPAQYFLFLTLIFIPLAGIASYIRIRRGKALRPKRQRYIVAIVMQLTILTVTLVAARAQGLTLLGRQWGNIFIWIGVAAYMAFLATRLRAAWAKLSDARKEKALILLPDDPSLMRLWIVVAALAGVSEECAYRGLAYQILRGIGFDVVLTLLICVTAFAIGHMTQGWRGVLGTFLLALVFHGLVFATGSLYLAIVFHAVYNLTVGMIAVPILSEYLKKRELMQPTPA